jgi:hypothetical protein
VWCWNRRRGVMLKLGGGRGGGTENMNWRSIENAVLEWRGVHEERGK